jgi:predicted nucleic acid-binding protein
VTSDEAYWYLDASALVKLVVAEAETPELRADLLGRRNLAGSELLFVEVPRSVASHDAEAAFRGRSIVESLSALVALDRSVLDAAALLPPTVLRSLDAIHLASALSFGADLAGMITYDRRLGDAAAAVGIEVASPGR